MEEIIVNFFSQFTETVKQTTSDPIISFSLMFLKGFFVFIICPGIIFLILLILPRILEEIAHAISVFFWNLKINRRNGFKNTTEGIEIFLCKLCLDPLVDLNSSRIIDEIMYLIKNEPLSLIYSEDKWIKKLRLDSQLWTDEVEKKDLLELFEEELPREFKKKRRKRKKKKAKDYFLPQ